MTKPYLSVEKLTQSFPDGKGGTLTVFEDATFGVEKGEFVCIIGHSGCGKSTLLYVLSTMDTDYEGQMIIDGQIATGKTQNSG